MRTWVEPFLASVRRGVSAEIAADLADVDRSVVYQHASDGTPEGLAFAERWREARRAGKRRRRKAKRRATRQFRARSVLHP